MRSSPVPCDPLDEFYNITGLGGPSRVGIHPQTQDYGPALSWGGGNAWCLLGSVGQTLLSQKVLFLSSPDGGPLYRHPGLLRTAASPASLSGTPGPEDIILGTPYLALKQAPSHGVRTRGPGSGRL